MHPESDTWGWPQRIAAIVIIALALLVLFGLARADAAPATGTGGGCKLWLDECKVVTDGAGHASSTTCRIGRHFSGAHVAAWRTFDPGSYYQVRGCAWGATEIRDVRIGGKVR